MKTHRIAFVGNPNVGKSAWLNSLSNANCKVGNWAGVTVKEEEIQAQWDHTSYTLVDLPGIYSLDENDNESFVTVEYLKTKSIDCIVNVVDATNLSSNLYFTLLLQTLQIPMIIVFNFMDEVKKYNIQIDIDAISSFLNTKIICGTPNNLKAIKQLKLEIANIVHCEAFTTLSFVPQDQAIIENASQRLYRYKPFYSSLSMQDCKLLILQLLDQKKSAYQQLKHMQMDLQKLQLPSKRLTHMLYDSVDYCMCFVKDQRKKDKITKAIDHIMLHSILGRLSMLACLILALICIFHISTPLSEYLDFLIVEIGLKHIQKWLFFLPEPLVLLLVNGIGKGVGSVCAFLPLIAMYSFVLGFMEESGILARIAYHMDPFMSKLNLNGKVFLSLLLGFGCNVPAIYALRTLDNQNQKKLSALLVPFMSCGARLPIYMIFASAFFPNKVILVVLSLYGIGICVALFIACFCYRRKKPKELFIIQLVQYRIPSFQVLKNKVKDEVQNYMKKATSIVMFAMIFVWGFSYFPKGDIQTSYLAHFGKEMGFLYEPLGFGNRWECISALPTSLLAKETILGFLGQVLPQSNELIENENSNSLKEDIQQIKEEGIKTINKLLFIDAKEENENHLKQQIQSLWQDSNASLRAYSYLTYILLMIPCIMTLQAIYREYGVKICLHSILYMSLLPYLISFIVYQGGLFLQTIFAMNL